MFNRIHNFNLRCILLFSNQFDLIQCPSKYTSIKVYHQLYQICFFYLQYIFILYFLYFQLKITLPYYLVYIRCYACIFIFFLYVPLFFKLINLFNYWALFFFSRLQKWPMRLWTNSFPLGGMCELLLSLGVILWLLLSALLLMSLPNGWCVVILKLVNCLYSISFIVYFYHI